MRGTNQVGGDILLTFNRTADVSRTFLSFLGQHQGRSFLK